MGNPDIDNSLTAKGGSARVYTSGHLRLPDNSMVHLSVRTNARRLTARRHGDIIKATVPPGLTVDSIMKFLSDVTRQLPQPESLPHYSEGQRICGPDMACVISRQSHKPDAILATPRLPDTYIEVGSEIDITSPAATRTITQMICRVAHSVADKVLLPQAHDIAARLGVAPHGWQIVSGYRRLGYCDPRGIISLSCVIVFLPAHLRAYIIKHEMAHLSEMNHSERFHALCDAYCDGREAELQREMRCFRWPFIRL